MKNSTSEPIQFPTDAEVQADIRKALRSVEAAQADCPDVAEIERAIGQLAASERGAQVSRSFRRLLIDGGIGLDTENWAALIVLCRACRGGAMSTTLNQLPTALSAR